MSSREFKKQARQRLLRDIALLKELDYLDGRAGIAAEKGGIERAAAVRTLQDNIRLSLFEAIEDLNLVVAHEKKKRK